MKKIIILAMAILMTAMLALSGCNKNQPSVKPTPQEEVKKEQGNTESNEHKSPSAPVGAEKAIEDLEKDADGVMSGEGIFMGPTTDDLYVILEKGKDTDPEINNYRVEKSVDLSKISSDKPVKFKFKVIDGKNTVISIEQ